MRRFCIYIAGGVAALILGLVLAFNLHLQSAAMQEQMHGAAMDTVGLPLSVRSVIYTPWDGIRLRGIVMPDMENAGVNFLEASEFQIVFRLFPLLRREFVVSRIALKEAVLTWRQNADGQWRVPRDPDQAIPAPSGTPLIARPAPPAEPPPAEPAEPAFGVRVESMEIKRSRILFENRDGWPLLDAEGISASAAVTPDGSATGRAAIPEAVLAGLIVSRDLGSDFTLTDGLLEFRDIRGDVAGGSLTGRGSIAIRADGSPYDWALQLRGFDMSHLRLPGSFGGTRFEGALAADFAINGRNAPQRQVRGRARFDLQDGRMVPSNYLQSLGQLVGIRELQGMRLGEAYAALRIEDDLIHVDPLWIRAEEFAVEMRGSMTRAGNLDLQARLLLSPSAASRLASLTGRTIPAANMKELPGFRAVNFKVDGTLERPQSDLASNLLGGGLGGRIGEMFLNFLGAP